MGFFTWTDARQEPRTKRNGDYYSSDMIRYGAYAKVVCPDNSAIVEPCYDGYGLFDGKDIYELVVDWNKEYLKDAFDKMSPDDWGFRYKEIALAYQYDKKSLLETLIHDMANSEGPYILKDWKRTIGIAIGCVSNKNDIRIPYPIKITKNRGRSTYQDMVPSYITQ